MADLAFVPDGDDQDLWKVILIEPVSEGAPTSPTTYSVKARRMSTAAPDIGTALHQANQIAKVLGLPIVARESLRGTVEAGAEPVPPAPPTSSEAVELKRRPWPGPLTAETNFEDYVYAAVDPVLDVWKFDDPARRAACSREMNEDQMALWSVWHVAGQIDNGGFAAIYRNSYGELAEDAIRGFRRFGLAAHADLVEEAFDSLERPVPLARIDRWRMLEAHLQAGTPSRSVATLGTVEWYGEIATKLTVLVGGVENRYFALKASQPDFLEVLARIVDARKDSFFALSSAGS